MKPSSYSFHIFLSTPFITVCANRPESGTGKQGCCRCFHGDGMDQCGVAGMLQRETQRWAGLDVLKSIYRRLRPISQANGPEQMGVDEELCICIAGSPVARTCNERWWMAMHWTNPKSSAIALFLKCLLATSRKRLANRWSPHFHMGHSCDWKLGDANQTQ